MVFKIFQSLSLFNQTSLPQPKLHPALEYLEQEATVIETIYGPYKSGQVFYQGSYYAARCVVDITLEPEQVCYVIAQRGLTLLVQPTPHP